jgi:hypothetical protein
MQDNGPTLFELRDEDKIRQDAIALNRHRIHDVICGFTPWLLSERQRRLLEVLRHRQGHSQAITIAELQDRVACGPREIKADVRELVVTFRLAIVASRIADAGGYFFATTAEERHTYSADYLKEAAKLIRRAQIIRNELDVNVLLGQIALDLKEGETK